MSGEFVPFEPFGYSFEVKSPSQPSDVKAVIRSRKKGWFDPKEGARGWILGPFICLWFSAFDRYGPMLFGRISQAGLGTKITGRAGSDLNGLLLFSGLLPIMALVLYQLIAAGDYTTLHLLIIGGILLLSPLVFLWSHNNRREAEPLVRFLRDAITTSGQSLRKKTAAVLVANAFTLNVGGEHRDRAVTPEAIHDALLAVGAGDFVILEAGQEAYIQTAPSDGGYILEKRDGDKQRHFQAVRRAVARSSSARSRTIFTFEEVHEAFMAYASGAPMPLFIAWEQMHLVH
jgi:hypothetical protein